MKISVALCTYNGSEYLKAQLQSIASQTVRPTELVAVDDGSADPTLEILSAFAENAPFPVHIYRNERNLGVTKNFDRALSLCTGELLFLSDQDDLWMPQKVERMARTFEEQRGANLIFTDARLVGERGQDLGQTLWGVGLITDAFQDKISGGDVFPQLLRRNYMTGATMALRKEFYDFATPFSEYWLHDAWLALVAQLSGQIHLISEPLIAYRQHQANVIGMKRISKVKKWKRSLAADRARFEREIKGTRDLLRFMEYNRPKIKAFGTRKALVEQRLHHFEKRQESTASLSQLLKLFPELLRGNYHRYSNGLQSFIRDMVSSS